MGKKRNNLILLKDDLVYKQQQQKEKEELVNFECNYNGDNDKIKRKRLKNSSVSCCACLIWILIAIICVLINKLYFNNEIKSSSLTHSNNFKSFQIVNFEHVTFPQIENGENKQKSQSELSSVNKNNHIEIGNDFNMIVFHEEEEERGGGGGNKVVNETKTGM